MFDGTADMWSLGIIFAIMLSAKPRQHPLGNDRALITDAEYL